jgi:spermidine/putrescine transport system permease protein
MGPLSAFFLSVPAVIWQVCFLYLPLVAVLSSSLYALDTLYALCDTTHIVIIVQSLIRAFFVAGVCVLLGYPACYYFAVKKRRYKNFFLFFMMLPFWTNFLVHIYSWFFVLDRYGLINRILLAIGIIKSPLQLLYTPFAVIVVMVYCYLPFMLLPLFSVLETFDYTLIEASHDLGATPRTTFWKITLPLTMQGIRNGFFLVFIPVFGEYAIPALVGGGKTLTIGGLISAYYLEARNPALGAAVTVLSCTFVLCVVWVLYNLLAGPRISSVERP